jgi:hypothetical protein
MVPPFDIFRVDSGNPIWIQAVDTIDAARARVAELMKTQPSAYLILNQSNASDKERPRHHVALCRG